MENIDDFMRQKFDSDDPGERFEFQEEYWEQAQALLEQAETRQRRRLWLFIALALLLALFAWVLVVMWGGESLSENKAGEQGSTSSTEKTESKNRVDGRLTNNETSSNVTGDTLYSAPQADEKGSNAPVSAVPSPGAGSAMTVPGKTENAAGGNTQKGVKTESSALRSLATNNAQSSRSNKNSTARPENTRNTSGKFSQSKNVAGSQALKSPVANETAPLNRDLQNPEKKTTDEGSSQMERKPSFEAIPVTTLPPATPPATIPIFTIPTPLTLFPLPMRRVAPRKPLAAAQEPIAEKIKPVQDQRFSFGWSMAGSAYPSDVNGRWAGWTLGAFGDYRLNNNLSLMLGAQWRFVPGHGVLLDTSTTVTVEQLRYSFGFEREEWKRDTRGLHYFEIPLSAHWRKGSWGLEGGGAAGRLLAVQNRTEYTVESSLIAAQTTIKKFEKGDIEPYNQTCFAAFLGAEYRLNKRLSVMAKGQYRFTPVFKKLGEGVQNNGLGNVDLGLRVRLF